MCSSTQKVKSVKHLLDSVSEIRRHFSFQRLTHYLSFCSGLPFLATHHSNSKSISLLSFLLVAIFALILEAKAKPRVPELGLHFPRCREPLWSFALTCEISRRLTRKFWLISSSVSYQMSSFCGGVSRTDQLNCSQFP